MSEELTQLIQQSTIGDPWFPRFPHLYRVLEWLQVSQVHIVLENDQEFPQFVDAVKVGVIRNEELVEGVNVGGRLLYLPAHLLEDGLNVARIALVIEGVYVWTLEVLLWLELRGAKVGLLTQLA